MAECLPGILSAKNLVPPMVRAQDSYPLASGRQFDPAPRCGNIPAFKASKLTGDYLLQWPEFITSF